jgi:hypothetical protein
VTTSHTNPSELIASSILPTNTSLLVYWWYSLYRHHCGCCVTCFLTRGRQLIMYSRRRGS